MRSFALATAGVFAAVLVGCSDAGTPTQSTNPGDPPPITGGVATVEVAPKSATVAVGSNTQLTVTSMDASGKAVGGVSPTFASSNPSVAEVSSAGVVHAVATGNVSVTATANGVKGSAAFTVSQAAVASVSVALTASSLTVGQTTNATATTRDANDNPLTGRAISWQSSNSSVATVNASGQVTAVAAGTANIIATSEGKTGQAALTVTVPASIPVASVSVSLSASSIQVGQSATATAVLKDANGNTLTGRSVSWQTSAPTVATVNSNGGITAVTAGTATITASSEGKSGAATLTVTSPAPAPVATVTVRLSSSSIVVGGTATATATLRDASNNVLTGRTVTWQSSPTSIATINSSGAIVGVSAGTATITATSEGKSGTASLTVVVPPPTNGSEPQIGASNTVVFRDDFETYDGTCHSMDVSGGGPWRTSSGTCGTDPNGEISSPNGTGYAGSASGVGGRSARFTWEESTSEQFLPLEAPVGGGFSGRGQAEYYSYMYRAPGFIYRTSYPRLGKKMFILFVGDGSTGRVTINPSEFSILQSNGVKIDSRFDHWPADLTSEEEYLAYLTDGRWHRYTVMRLPETSTGAMDGALRVWVDGYLVIDRTKFGTFSGATSSLVLASTFNGGSSALQTEYYDSIRAWR